MYWFLWGNTTYPSLAYKGVSFGKIALDYLYKNNSEYFFKKIDIYCKTVKCLFVIQGFYILTKYFKNCKLTSELQYKEVDFKIRDFFF